MLDAKLILHSVSSLGHEAVTWELTIPKWMVAELNTHKAEIERNSASSRAIPVEQVISMVMSDPFVPDEWYYSHPGMVAEELMDERDAAYAREIWLKARNDMVIHAQSLLNLPSGRKAEKIANRLMETFLWTKVVVTFTLGGKIGFNNFMGLRDNKAAQKEFRVVANMMHEQYHASKAKRAAYHFPYVSSDYRIYDLANNMNLCTVENMGLISAARCGRVTYMKQGIQEYTIENEINRGRTFFADGHFSPLRHPLIAGESKWYGNQFGWIPISKYISPVGIDYVTKCCERAS